MDYCPSCRRHLNGALACPGCGAYSDRARRAEFQAQYQNPYQAVPAVPAVPAQRGAPEEAAVPAGFSPAYGGHGGYPEAPAPSAGAYGGLDFTGDHAGEAAPAEQPRAAWGREEHEEGHGEAAALLDLEGEDGDAAEPGGNAETDGATQLMPAGAGRAARRQGSGPGRGRGQNHRQSRRRRRTAAFTAVGLVVGGLVAWEGGVSALSLGEFGQAPVAAPDSEPSDSPSASASGGGATSPAGGGVGGAGATATARARASSSAKASASASASPSASASARTGRPAGTPTAGQGGGGVTSAPTTSQSTPSPTSASPTSSPSQGCSSHFLWWCTG